MALEGTTANHIGFGLAVSRHAQCLCALLSYLVFQRHFSHVSRASLQVDGSFQAIPPMNIVTLVYASIVLVAVFTMKSRSISTWYKFGMATVPFDLTMAIISLVVAILLNSTRLDCQNLLREKFVRKPIGSMGNSVFTSDRRYGIDDIDRQCAASLFIYWISLTLVLLYSLSILLTILRLKHYRQLLLDKWDELASVYIESIIEAQVQQVVERLTSGASWRSPRLSPRSPERAAFMPGFGPHGFEIPVIYRQRPSQENTSSYHADLSLIDNGYRSAEEASTQSSSSGPSSLYSYKGD